MASILMCVQHSNVGLFVEMLLGVLACGLLPIAFAHGRRVGRRERR